MDRSILLDRDAAAPLYQQIADELRAAMRAGRLAEGERLPATRDLAQDLGVNRVTVQLAYRHLQDEGWIRSHVGQGSFVAERPSGSPPVPPIRAEAARSEAFLQPPLVGSICSAPVERLFQLARSSAAMPELGADGIDFSGRVPDERLFDVAEFQRAMDRVLRERGAELLQYGPPAGDENLRAWIAARLRGRGLAARAEDILLVSGAQQGLSLIAQTLAASGDTVATESPTYHQALDIFAGLGLEVATVATDAGGMRIDDAAEVLRTASPRLLYTMPEFQNPTGITQSHATRAALVKLAAAANVPLVEDDFEHELRFRGTALPPLAAFPGARHVIHLGTFSKGLFPGVRVGWIYTEPALLARMAQLKRTLDLSGGALIQAALFEFVRGDAYERHLEVLRSSLARKHEAAQTALHKHLGSRAHWTAPDGGYALWIELDAAVDAVQLQRYAAREGVVYTPGQLFFDTPPQKTCLRLSLSRVDLERIEPGVQRLARAIDAACKLRAGPVLGSTWPLL